MKKLIAIAALAAGTCFADTTPAMVSLVTPVQYPACDWSVTGLRFDWLYGQAHNVKGLDLGFINHATGDVTGIELGCAHIVKGGFLGGQLGFVNLTGTTRGVQFGFVNYTANMESGLQLGFINIIEKNGWLPIFPFINGGF